MSLGEPANMLLLTSRHKQVYTTCDQLVETISSIHNANISESERMAFYRRRDEFLKSSPVRVKCALLLTKHKSALVRVFAFETLSYSIKFRWNTIDTTTLNEIKATVEYYLGVGCYDGDDDIDEQHNQLKIALIDLTVEVMKREWPGLWKPNFFDIANEGPAQTDLVLSTFLVLFQRIQQSSSDVTLSLSTNAKKRLNDGLRFAAKDLIGFLRDTVERYNLKLSFSSMSAEKHSDSIIQSSVRLLRKCLLLVADLDLYIVNATMVTLSAVIPGERFSTDAADCFACTANKIKQSNVLKFLIRNILITDLFERLYGFLLQHQVNEQQQQQQLYYDKAIYESVLNLSKFLMSFSLLLFKLSQKCKNEELHDAMLDDARCYRSFEAYTQMLFSLYNCNWLCIVYNVTLAWKMLLDIPTLATHSLVFGVISKLPESIIGKLIEVPYEITDENDVDNSLQQRSECIRYEFQSEDAYCAFYRRFLTELTGVLAKMTTINPDFMLVIISEMIDRCVNEATSPELSLFKKRSDWSCLKYLTRYVISSSMNTIDLPIRLLTSLQSINSNFIRRLSDPVILSHTLRCIDHTVYFLSTRNCPPDILSSYLFETVNGIFYCFDLSTTAPAIEINGLKENNVGTLYEEAGNLLVKVCKLCPDKMMAHFNEMRLRYYTYIIKPKSSWPALFLVRSLIVLNNENRNFHLQTQFLESVMLDVRLYWLVNKPSFNTVEQFSDYIGLNDAVQYQQEDHGDDINTVSSSVIITASERKSDENRAILLFKVYVLKAVLYCSSYPKDSTVCGEGGFLKNHESGRVNLLIDPCVPHVVPLLPLVLLFLKGLNSLWTRDQRQSLSTKYKGIFGITDYEVQLLAKIHNPQKYDESVYIYYSNNRRDGDSKKFMRDYMATLYETVIEILAVSCNVTMYDFFHKPEITENLNASLLYNLHCIPDYRLSVILKNVVLMLIVNCPPSSHDSILIPLFERLSVHMEERLNIRWTFLRTYTTEQPKPVNEQDALAYNVIKTLIDDYANVLRAVLIITMSDVDQMMPVQALDEVDKLSASLSNLRIKSDSGSDDDRLISDVGVNILRNREIGQALKKFSLNYLCGEGLRPRLKYLRVFSALIRYMYTTTTLRYVDSDDVEKLFRGLLRLCSSSSSSINVGGKQIFHIVVNEITEVYSTFRVDFPILLEILAETILEKDSRKLRLFDNKILNCTFENWGRKGRCKMLKELLLPSCSTE